jgi:hypothetical protein
VNKAHTKKKLMDNIYRQSNVNKSLARHIAKYWRTSTSVERRFSSA